jgi:hypothetical protein
MHSSELLNTLSNFFAKPVFNEIHQGYKARPSSDGPGHKEWGRIDLDRPLLHFDSN